MKTNKFTFFMEKLWLAIAIATAIYTIYRVYIGAEMNNLEYLMPILAFVLFYTRRTLRKKLEAAADRLDEDDQ